MSALVKKITFGTKGFTLNTELLTPESVDPRESTIAYAAISSLCVIENWNTWSEENPLMPCLCVQFLGNKVITAFLFGESLSLVKDWYAELSRHVAGLP